MQEQIKDYGWVPFPYFQHVFIGLLVFSFYNWEKINENLDEKMHGLHDYLKFVKYGFGRATDHSCIDIRNNRLTREEGLKLVKQFDGKYPHYSINEFVNYTGMTKAEIDAIIDSFTNSILFEQDENGNFVKDVEGNLKRNFEIQ